MKNDGGDLKGIAAGKVGEVRRNNDHPFPNRKGTAVQVIGWDSGEGRRKEIFAETVILALGAESVSFPVESLKMAGIDCRLIGDAREPWGIAEAVREGYLAGISF